MFNNLFTEENHFKGFLIFFCEYIAKDPSFFETYIFFASVIYVQQSVQTSETDTSDILMKTFSPEILGQFNFEK